MLDTLLILSLLGFLSDFHVSGCDLTCPDRTTFSPPTLVVKHGDPTSATCSLCPGCPDAIFNLEKAFGESLINGTTITWTVKEMKEWGTSPLCYYTNGTGHQCCTKLEVLVYKPPDLVSISFLNHSGPLLESRGYTLQCEVQSVAPVGSLAVTFYRGQTELGRTRSSSKLQAKPVTELFNLGIRPSKEDDGAQYRCEAKLELGPDGPATPPMVTSQKVTAAVHYKPWRPGPALPEEITLTQGDSLELNCTALGNPRPWYNWTVPLAAAPPPDSSVLTILSVGFKHGGKYVCSVSNAAGANTVVFRVDVQPYILPSILISVVLVLFAVIAGGIWCYKHNRCRQYNVRDVLHLHNHQHVAVPSDE